MPKLEHNNGINRTLIKEKYFLNKRHAEKKLYLLALNELCDGMETLLSIPKDKLTPADHHHLKAYLLKLGATIINIDYKSIQEYERVHDLLAKVPEEDKTPAFYLASWRCKNKIALISNIIFEPDRGKKLFAEAARDLWQMRHLHREPAFYRILAMECDYDADLCESRADALGEKTQYEFALNLLKTIAPAKRIDTDYQLMAVCHINLATHSYNPATVFYHYQEAKHFLEKIKTPSAKDQRYFATCYAKLGDFDCVHANYKMANKHFEKAIAALCDIPENDRNEKDKANLSSYRMQAASAESENAGCFSSIKNYGFFANRSKTENKRAEKQSALTLR